MDALSIFAIAVGIVGGLGGVAGYFKSGRGETIIRLQAVEIDTLAGKNTRLEKDYATVSTERDRYREENATLKELAQGSPQLAVLTAAINNQTEMLSRALESKTTKGRNR